MSSSLAHVGHDDLTRLAAVLPAHDAHLFQFVHDAARPVVAEAEVALDGRCGALPVLDDEVGHLYQHVVGVGRLFASSSVAASGRPFEPRRRGVRKARRIPPAG